MTGYALLFLIIVFFVTSAVGVVTGSNSLITVPVMLQFGIDAKTAVATNMFGLTFLSIGGALPFARKGVFDKKRLPLLILLTLISSGIGAGLVSVISGKVFPLIISISMIVVVIFTILKRDSGIENKEVSTVSAFTAFALTFILGIYGGIYSGGYVTVLTTVFVGMLGMTFTEAVANTKIINVFSSLIATLIFMWQGLIDYKLGLILAVTMFVAAFIGAKIVTKLNDVWLKRIFLGTVALLAIKLIVDFGIK